MRTSCEGCDKYNSRKMFFLSSSPWYLFQCILLFLSTKDMVHIIKGDKSNILLRPLFRIQPSEYNNEKQRRMFLTISEEQRLQQEGLFPSGVKGTRLAFFPYHSLWEKQCGDIFELQWILQPGTPGTKQWMTFRMLELGYSIFIANGLTIVRS